MLLPSLETAQTYDHLYIAPHLDDAVLSCGGRIALQREAGESVLVVTVCAGIPPTDADPPPFVRHLHQAWALGNDPIVQRRAEDAAALAVLNCDGIHLDLLDAPYRLPEYGERNAVFGTPAPDDPLLPAVRSTLRHLHQQQPHAHFHVPFGVGNHVDHLLVYAAGLALYDAGGDVVWYEDTPYAATQPAAFEARLDQVQEHFVSEVLDIERVMEHKLQAVRCYASQFGELFGTAPMEQVMTEYAATVMNGRGFGERVWRRTRADLNGNSQSSVQHTLH